MSTESQLLVWKGEGLPADDLSQVWPQKVEVDVSTCHVSGEF